MSDKIDPELADDKDIDAEEDIPEVELPEYDHSQFEVADDFEYVEETEDEEDGG